MLGPIDFTRLESALVAPRGWFDLAIVVICVGVAWMADRRIEARFRAAQTGSRYRLRGGVGRVVFPLLALLLLTFARAAYRNTGDAPLFIDIAIPLLIALAAIRLLLYAMRKLFAEQAWLKTSERAIAFSIWGLVVLYFIGVLPEVGRELDAIALPLGSSSVSLLTIAKAAAVIVLTLIVTLWLSSLLENWLVQRTAFDTNTKAVLTKLLSAVLLVVGALVALQAIGFDLTLLTVFGGALGVGIGLGLQKLAANYIAGFTILLERSVRLGDMITVDTRQGRVAKVTSRYVALRCLDGIEAIVPNETLVTTTVLNHTHTGHDIRVSTPVQVTYDSDLGLALRLLEEAAQSEPRLARATDPPTAFVSAFADSGINVELVLWLTGPPPGVLKVKSDLNRRIFDAFQRNGIEFAYPRRDIRMVEQAPANASDARGTS